MSFYPIQTPGIELNNLQLLLPRISDASSTLYTTTTKQTTLINFSGNSNITYAITLRFRGVVEGKTYAGGVGDGYFWNANGTPVIDGYNIYSLQTSSPLAIYYLNSGTSGVTALNSIDYTKTILVNGGATITLVADPVDGIEVANNASTGGPLSVGGIVSPTQPYVGQFVRIDFISSVISPTKAQLAPPDITANDVLVWRCNDGPNAAILTCQGTYGTSSYVSPIAATSTTANFTVPAVASNVTIAVVSTVGYYVGAPVMIGGGAGRYTIASIASLVSMAVTNNASAGNTTLGGLNAATGSTITNPATVTPIIENSPTTVTVDFTIPSVGSNVQITVASTNGYIINGQIYIGSAGYYQVVTVDSAVLMTVKNLIVANLASGSICRAGATVAPNQDMIVSTTDHPIKCNGPFTDALFFPKESACAYGTFTSTAAKFFGTQLTIENWFKPPDLLTSIAEEWFGRQTNISNWVSGSFGNIRHVCSAASPNYGLWACFGDPGFGGSVVNTNGRFVVGQWNYFVTTIDFSQTTNNFLMYLNGTLVSTFSISNAGVAWNRFVWSATTGAWYVGTTRSAVGTWVTPDCTFGALAECRVHQGIHSANHIASIWNSRKH